MSYGIMAYAVSLNKVESALGKSNAKRGLLGRLFGPSTASLVEKLKQKSAYRFEQDEEDLDEEDEQHTLTLEQAIAYIDDDELVEVTPNAIRLRKRFLDPHDRKRNSRSK